MSRSSVVQSPSAPVQKPWYRDDLLPQIQTSLAALADLEVQCEIERGRILESAHPERVRQDLLEGLARWQRQEREMHLERVAGLHQEMMNAITFQDICTTA